MALGVSIPSCSPLPSMYICTCVHVLMSARLGVCTPDRLKGQLPSRCPQHEQLGSLGSPWRP